VQKDKDRYPLFPELLKHQTAEERLAPIAVEQETWWQQMRDRFFTVIKFWMDETSGVALALRGGVPSYQVEDEEGRIHLLIHPPIEEEDEDRWCLWRPDQAGFDSRSIFESGLPEE
jgi:hypothetical protein